MAESKVKTGYSLGPNAGRGPGDPTRLEVAPSQESQKHTFLKGLHIFISLVREHREKILF